MKGLLINKKITLFLSIMMMVVFFVGCSTYSGMSIMQRGRSTENSMSYSYKYFNGNHTVVLHLKKDIKIGIDYDVIIKSGEIVIRLVDDQGNDVWDESFVSDAKDSVAIEISKAGIYKIVIEGKETEGGFEVKYNEL